MGSAWTGVPLALAAAVRWGYPAGFGFAVGLGWALVNLWAIAAIVRATITPHRRWSGRAAVLVFVKLAVYAAGVLLLVSGWFPPAALVAGFSWLLAVIVLRAAGAMFLARGSDARDGETGKRSGGE